MKYLILDVSNEWETMVAVIEWDDERAKAIQERMVIVKELHEKDGSFASVAFYSDFDLFEYGSQFEEWLADRKLEEDWENDSIICDERPQTDEQIRLDLVRFNISKYGFWWTIRPKHSDIHMESPYFSMVDDKTKQLLEMT